MNQKRSRTIGHSHSHQQIKTRKKSKRKSMNMLQLQQKFFEYSPWALYEILSALPSDELQNDDEVEDDTLLDGLVELDSDIDVFDEDTESIDETNISQIRDFGGLLNESITFQDLPTLTPATKYTIVVIKDAGGKMVCRFESPFDSYGRLPKIAAQVIIPKLVGFIKATAFWFQAHKQAFLKNPSPENFVDGETDFSEEPIVMQKWFLARINEKISPSLQMSLPNFSRMLNNVWIVWPLCNMPLKTIFSVDFKEAWLVEVCSVFYEKASEIWRQKLNNPKFTKKDIQTIKNRSFSFLNPDEKLHFLRDAVKIPIARTESIWHDSVMRLKRSTHGEKAS